MNNRHAGREMSTSRLANATAPALSSVNPVMMNAASAGPSNPGSCVVLDQGAVRTPASASGIQYAQERPYASTKKLTNGCDGRMS